MSVETGQVSIHTENILPIIKKWLYSERDIFLRELVSNAADAILKLEKISLMSDGKIPQPEPKIEISIDANAKKITISDTGIGMTAEEIKRYINQIAFSGLSDFVEKYQGKEDKDQIIGHFGLGFYSSFMVAHTVEIDSLSYQEGAEPAYWISQGDGQFELKPGSRKNVGTTVILSISDDNKDLLDPANLRQIAIKYAGFLRYPVYLNGDQINETQPLWTKNPSQLKDDDYLQFFDKLFPFQEKPLFWMHLNVDYPFRLRGILYFPKLSHELAASEGQVKLFCNQVFVEDNCKQLIPEYLTLLKGVIDCPDLPLNVSRSALQKDVTVQKISQHITKKVCDKLSGMCKVERSEYEKYWEDINPFIKYAMMRDPQFADRLKDFVIFKCTDDKYRTAKEYIEEFYKDKPEVKDKKIYYTSHQSAQKNFIEMLKAHGYEAIICDRVLDQHFLPFFEMHTRGEYKFQRVDAELVNANSTKASEQEIIDPQDNKTPTQKLTDIFKKALNDDQVEIVVENIDRSKVAAFYLLDENTRRLGEMARYSPIPDFSALNNKKKFVINKSSPAIKNLLDLARRPGREQDVDLLTKEICDLAQLQTGALTPELLESFINRTTDILARIGQ